MMKGAGASTTMRPAARGSRDRQVDSPNYGMPSPGSSSRANIGLSWLRRSEGHSSMAQSSRVGFLGIALPYVS